METEWEAVLVADTIATAQLLPESMRIGPEGFILDEFTTSNEVRLGEVCDICTCFEGPIPPIELAPQDWPMKLPPGLSEATLDGGTARLTLHNEIGFDVLDDGQGGKGWLVVEFVDIRTEKVLDSVRVAGSFPSGDSLVVVFDLSNLVLSSYLVARVSGRTPGSGCDDFELTPELGFRADVSLEDVVASSVWVLVSDWAVSLPDREFELPALIADRLRPGDAEVTVEVELGTRLPTSMELTLSAAADPAHLFTDQAALYTPLPLPAGARDQTLRIRKEYVVDVAPLQGAERLYLATRNRITGSRRVELRGSEGVEYRVTLKARIPSR